MGDIRFQSQKKSFKLTSPKKTTAWLRRVIKSEGSTLDALSYVFCTDAFLLKINQDFLNHDTLTDIVTFDLSENEAAINGEIYISIDRVKENARLFHVDFDTELHRVIVHGVLHLLGYGDKSARAKALMRRKEEACLSLRP